MLVELSIENFAIIDQLDLKFDKGLITFTGETGAGKSIIIDALEVLLGGRADATMVRSGSETALIEGVFRVPENISQHLASILERENLTEDSEWLSLSREIRLNGRNAGRLNGSTVSVSLLREVGELLVDVHGQSEHLSLLRVSQHLELLDRYASSSPPDSPEAEGVRELENVRKRYQGTYKEILELQKRLETLQISERDAARRSDMLNFQIQEIESARLKPGDESDLIEERNRLANAESLVTLAQDALMTLDEGTPDTLAITDLYGQLVDNLSGLAKYDPTQASLYEENQVIFDRITELAREIRIYIEGIEFNPRRLDQVEERLNLIHNLKRKYGDTVDQILEFEQKARAELDTITHAKEKIEELEAAIQELKNRLAQEGQSLSRLRHAASKQLNVSIEGELEDLNMSGARFRVDFYQQPDPYGVEMDDGSVISYSLTGLEKVEFLIAPNPGEGFKPLVKIASGGETSRLMLALKNVLARADEIPTLIFDEIDQGIGGRVGTVVGEKLWNLARDHQVMCITHLPQLAVFGEQHFGVEKAIEDGRTITLVKTIAGQDRLAELAKMMGEISEGTLHSAREMLLSAQKKTTIHLTKV